MGAQDLLEGAGLGLGAPDSGGRMGWVGEWGAACEYGCRSGLTGLKPGISQYPASPRKSANLSTSGVPHFPV